MESCDDFARAVSMIREAFKRYRGGDVDARVVKLSPHRCPLHEPWPRCCLGNSIANGLPVTGGWICNPVRAKDDQSRIIAVKLVGHFWNAVADKANDATEAWIDTTPVSPDLFLRLLVRDDAKTVLRNTVEHFAFKIEMCGHEDVPHSPELLNDLGDYGYWVSADGHVGIDLPNYDDGCFSWLRLWWERRNYRIGPTIVICATTMKDVAKRASELTVPPHALVYELKE